MELILLYPFDSFIPYRGFNAVCCPVINEIEEMIRKKMNNELSLEEAKDSFQEKDLNKVYRKYQRQEETELDGQFGILEKELVVLLNNYIIQNIVNQVCFQ